MSQHALRQTPPPVNRITHACENITLPRTSFADGNKVGEEETRLCFRVYARGILSKNFSSGKRRPTGRLLLWFNVITRDRDSLL